MEDNCLVMDFMVSQVEFVTRNILEPGLLCPGLNMDEMDGYFAITMFD